MQIEQKSVYSWQLSLPNRCQFHRFFVIVLQISVAELPKYYGKLSYLQLDVQQLQYLDSLQYSR